MITENSFTRLDNDINGNPRYYVPIYLFPEGLGDKLRRSMGLTKYRGKKYGAGYTVQSYNLAHTISHINETFKRYSK